MAASYPGSIKSFTTKTNNVDTVDAAHINDLQDEVEAIQTELGADVAGDYSDLVTRLAKESIKARGKISYSGGTPTLDDDFNVASIGDTAAGKCTITIDTDFADGNYTVMGSNDRDGGGSSSLFGHYSAAAGSVVVTNANSGDGAFADAATITFALIGDR